VRATGEQIESARIDIAQTPGVTIDRYLGQGEAHDQFACIFADNPDLVDSVSGADLPVSFAVKSDSASSDLIARLKATPGVQAVYTPEEWQTHVDEERAGEVGPALSSQR